MRALDWPGCRRAATFAEAPDRTRSGCTLSTYLTTARFQSSHTLYGFPLRECVAFVNGHADYVIRCRHLSCGANSPTRAGIQFQPWMSPTKTRTYAST